MDFNTLEKLIDEIAKQKEIDTSTIVADLADILKMKYGISIMEKERDFIDEVKNKIITRLYNAEDHKISADSDLQKVFKLDRLENEFIDNSLDELQQEGLLQIDKKEYALTREGIMKFKEFYGEI